MILDLKGFTLLIFKLHHRAEKCGTIIIFLSSILTIRAFTLRPCRTNMLAREM